MKKLLFMLAFAALATAGYSQQATATDELAVLEWVSTTNDFGKIKQGVPVTHEFRFTNKGKVPLLITAVQASCGCTTPDWSREPVAPGQTGFVKATFNAVSPGMFEKAVTVTANIENNSVMLKIKGEVVPNAQ